MSEGPATPNLQALDDGGYAILGELRGAGGSRTFIAKRRADAADVLITVVRAPETGEQNALSHFAADVQLLAKIEHPNVPTVLEGRWIGKDEFAVVTRRVQADTLGEHLARGEQISPPRISAILQQVVGILEWARMNGIVHRGAPPDAVMFERGTNRVLMSLAPTPIPMEGVPDAASDARTVGMLAWAMFTGEPYADGQSLSEMRPDLARRVVDETEAFVRARIGDDVPDVPTFLGVIAAADALKAGELEIAQIEAQLLDERRDEIERFEKEQEGYARRSAELEAQLARERAEFQRRMEAEEAELASMKAQFKRLKANEESQISAERAQFDEERREFEERVDELAARQAALDARSAELTKLRAEEGQRIDAAITAAVKAVAATAAVESAGDDRHRRRKPGAAKAQRVPWVDKTVREYSVGPGEAAFPRAVAADRRRRRRWMIPAAALAALGVLVASAIGVAYNDRPSVRDVAPGTPATVPIAPAPTPASPPRGDSLTRSASGTIAPTPATRVKPVTPKAKPVLPVADRGDVDTAAPPERSAFTAEAFAIERAEKARRDSIARDSSRKRDTTRVRPDTTG